MATTTAIAATTGIVGSPSSGIRPHGQSRGMTLRCLAAHPNVQSMSLDQGGLLVGNIFGERFRLTPVSVEGTLALHTSILSS